MNKIRGKERRKFIRLRAYHLAKYKLLSAKEPHAAYTIAGIRDIGAGGICLVTKEPLPIASVIELQIKFPKLETPIFTVAKVVWIKQLRKHNLYETGAQFMEIEESTRKIIDEQAKFVEEAAEKEKTGLFSRLFSGKNK